jgi:hypothetical protein
MKQKFGWFITATYYVILLCDRIMNVVNVIIGGFEQMPFFGALIGLLITFALMSYVLSGNAQEVFKIKTSVPLVVALVLGIAIGGGIQAAAYMAGKEAAKQAFLPSKQIHDSLAGSGFGYKSGSCLALSCKCEFVRAV